MTKYVFLCSIICNDEFSSRLSINSILRLRSAAISALSDNSPADTAMIQKLARRILHVNRYHDNGTHGPGDDIIEGYSDRTIVAGGHIFVWNSLLSSLYAVLNLSGLCFAKDHPTFLQSSLTGLFCFTGPAIPSERSIIHQDSLCNSEPGLQNMQNGFVGYSGSNASTGEHLSYEGLNNDQDMQIIPVDGSDSGFTEHPASYREIPVEPPEMFLPGLIVHIVRQRRGLFPLWQCWNIQQTGPPYKAVLAKRENFKDIVVTPSMFTDHLPWR
jgi:hypothetical protein